MISRRREERLVTAVSVRIWGMDANGKPFSVPATTYDVTPRGARVSGIVVPLTIGEVVGMQHGEEKARFRVAWCGRPGTRFEGHIGLQAIDHKKHIWGSLLKDTTAAPTIITANFEPLPPQVPPEAVFDPLTGRRADIAASSVFHEIKRADRRLATRYFCEGTAEIIDADSGLKVTADVSSVSLSGCFIRTRVKFPTAVPMQAVLRIEGTEIRCVVTVRSVDEGIGYGLRFFELGKGGLASLTALVQRLADEKSAAALAARETPTASALSETIEALASQLRQLDALVVETGDTLDPKLAHTARAQFDQARQAAVALQQWIEFSLQEKDTEPVVAEYNLRRVRYCTQLLRELLAEIEAEDFSLERPGASELLSVAFQLYKRLAWLAEKRKTATQGR